MAISTNKQTFWPTGPSSVGVLSPLDFQKLEQMPLVQLHETNHWEDETLLQIHTKAMFGWNNIHIGALEGGPERVQSSNVSDPAALPSYHNKGGANNPHLKFTFKGTVYLIMFGLDERINTIPVSCIELAST